MRIHHLQHVPFEGLGSMEDFFVSRGHALSATHLYLAEPLPNIEELDWLIVMGGPMGVKDEDKYAWLKEEKAFIRRAMDAGKRVLGICLGAQLMAHALGARVYPNESREIGWFPIRPTAEAADLMPGVFPKEIDTFHWHGDTFDIPQGATLMATSEACQNQAFAMDDGVVGLQFHLETTRRSAMDLIENSRGELDGSRHVQSEEEMLADDRRFNEINTIMLRLLEFMEGTNG